MALSREVDPTAPAAERIGEWVLVNMGEDLDAGADRADVIINALGGSSVPDALQEIAASLRDSHDDEAGLDGR